MAVGQAHANGLGEAGRRVCASGERPVDEREASSGVPWRRPTARGCCLGRSDGRTFRCPPFRVIPARPVAQRASRAAPVAFTFRLWTLACFQRGARAECAAARGGLHWARPASRCWVPRSFCARPTPKTNDLRGRRAARKQKAAAHLSGDLSESPFETWLVRLGTCLRTFVFGRVRHCSPEYARSARGSGCRFFPGRKTMALTWLPSIGSEARGTSDRQGVRSHCFARRWTLGRL